MELKKILIVRSANIGDLLCTTPMLRALKIHYPGSKLSVLVNSYNYHIVEDNPDVDEVLVYEKAKHGHGRLRAWWRAFRLFSDIRGRNFDLAIGASADFNRKIAKMVHASGARERIGYVRGGEGRQFYSTPLPEELEPLHEVEYVFRLLAPLGITEKPGPLVLPVPTIEKEKGRQFLESSKADPCGVVAVHISSRKPVNRWPVERFRDLVRELRTGHNVTPLFLWSPGDESNPFHPGDDGAAQWLKEQLGNEALFYRTSTLKELVGILSLCRAMVCCDGGALHIGAALQLPMVAIFGSTNPGKWAPWMTRHVMVKKGETALDNNVDDVAAAFDTLWKGLAQ
ncbi:MAG: glycosyltransferase family 9 protein [Nitrospirota bacterium]|nr:glycosyltransferase family 9 protein [Nitrospirota bacterium]